ncbi:MAG: MerR family transcriptional regulator [Acidimicrobiales bacterium]
MVDDDSGGGRADRGAGPDLGVVGEAAGDRPDGADDGRQVDGDPAGGPGDDVTYTIDELSALTGVPSRTIRFYQSKGTLPAPERRGRVAVYRAEHVDRLRVIAELQDRGLRLDAIRDVLEQVERGGDSLYGWLGLGERLRAPWTDDRPLVVDQDELLRRLGIAGDHAEGADERPNRPGLIGELERAGLIRREGHSLPATFVIPSPELLDIVVQLDAAGIDIPTAFGAGEILRRRLAKAADELVGFFDGQTGRGFAGTADVDELIGAVDALRPLGSRAVQLIFAQEMERALRSFVESGQAIRPRGESSGSGGSGDGHRHGSSRRRRR